MSAFLRAVREEQWMRHPAGHPAGWLRCAWVVWREGQVTPYRAVARGLSGGAQTALNRFYRAESPTERIMLLRHLESVASAQAFLAAGLAHEQQLEPSDDDVAAISSTWHGVEETLHLLRDIETARNGQGSLDGRSTQLRAWEQDVVDMFETYARAAVDCPPDARVEVLPSLLCKLLVPVRLAFGEDAAEEIASVLDAYWWRVGWPDETAVRMLNRLRGDEAEETVSA